MASKSEIKKVIQRYNDLESAKSHWNTHWDDLAHVMLPRRRGFTNAGTPGDQRAEDIFDSTPMMSARSFGNGLGTFLRPDNEDWIHPRIVDPSISRDEQAREWLQDTRKRLSDAIYAPKSRFRQATGEVDMDLVVFGTGLIFTGETSDMRNLLFQSIDLREAIPVYNEEGNLEGMFRKRRMPLRHLIQKFGQDGKRLGKGQFSDKTKKLIEKEKWDEKIEILHAVLPRNPSEVSPAPIFSNKMPFTDQWIEVGEDHEIFNGGYMELPFAAPRWDTSSGEDYGRSPGMIALPDANTLQAMDETILVAGQKAADPPLMAPNDGSFSEIYAVPGGIGYYDVETATQLGGNPFFPLQSGVNLPITRDMQVDKRQQVMMAFFQNVLNLPINGPQMTATEVIARKQEFVRELGPVMGRLESDYTAPIIERAFNVMLRAGGFAPIPPVLQGQDIVFQFESPVNKIREQVEAAAARLWAEETLALAQFDPDIVDLPNLDEIARMDADAKGLPARVVRPRSEVEDIRKQRQQAQQAQMQAAMMNQGADTAEKFSKVAKNTGINLSEAEAV